MNKSKKNKQLSNEKGITLIALVITIIILIILAGVSINIVFTNDGLINKAEKAAENMEMAQLEEQEMINELVKDLEGNRVPIQQEEPEILEGPVEGGSYDNPYIPTGFTHVKGDGTWNSGYVITETSTGNKFVWVPCVLDPEKVKDEDKGKVVTFGRTLPETTAKTDPYYKYNEYNMKIKEEASPASDITTSVGTYGGFYIAAYEAGVPVGKDGNEIAATSATVTQKARSVEGANTWTNITRTDAIAAASNMIDSSVAGVNSGLISGEAWDTTLRWMVTTSDNALSNADYDTNSSGKGWYNDVSKNQKATTGKCPINNIYDMAGNVWEWTTENGTYNGTSVVINRGGDYRYSGLEYPVSSRYHSANSTNNLIAFRVVLYK